ncbi:TPA: ATP-binding protein, partial [Clostridioides difficile]|nr:ATP-binding protein [Clostridioides difficile]
MLETYVFWIILTIVSATIEWTVLKFILDEISELRNKKLVLNSSLLLAIMTITILTLVEFNINIKLL